MNNATIFYLVVLNGNEGQGGPDNICAVEKFDTLEDIIIWDKQVTLPCEWFSLAGCNPPERGRSIEVIITNDNSKAGAHIWKITCPD
jgi:hypothetical protein